MPIDKPALARTMRSLEEAAIQAAEHSYQEILSEARIDRDETVDLDVAAQSATTSNLAGQVEQQLQEHRTNLRQLEAVDFGPRTEVELGAVVKLVGDDRHLVVAISTSAFECDGIAYMGISPRAPLYRAMEGLEEGESFDLGERELEIELIC